MSLTTFRDVLWAFAQSLQVSTLFPASLFVWVNAYLVLPNLAKVNHDTPASIILLVGFTLLISYLMYAFNFPAIRLLEGYRFDRLDIFQAGQKRHSEKHVELIKQIKQLDRERSLIKEEMGFDPDQERAKPLTGDQAHRWGEVNHKLARLLQDFDYLYPGDPSEVLPTKLGNVIRAFESYPGSRYGMDGIACWPRLVPILNKSGFLPFVAQEKSVFDFLLNMLFVVPALGLELFLLQLFLLNIPIALVCLVVTSFATWILYQGLTVAAGQWGMTVRVAFDLHRHTLHQWLHLQPMTTPEADRAIWEQTSAFLLYRPYKKTAFEGFLPSAKVNNRSDELP